MTLTLAQMQPGEIGQVLGFHAGDRAYRQKLLSMGLTPNTYFKVIRRAPMGDPIQIQVHAYFLSLRQNEAQLLKIERVSPDG
jgi:ferrous iron transport protein A